jgi:hypothetical protein
MLGVLLLMHNLSFGYISFLHLILVAFIVQFDSFVANIGCYFGAKMASKANWYLYAPAGLRRRIKDKQVRSQSSLCGQF